MKLSFDNLNWTGRYLDHDGIRYFDYSASGFCFVMTGKKAEATQYDYTIGKYLFI